jgi:hypothetical protein
MSAGGSFEMKGFSFSIICDWASTIQAGMSLFMKKGNVLAFALMAYGSAPVHPG